MESTHEVIRSQLERCSIDPGKGDDQTVITIHHAGGVAVLTPSQGRQVLAGGELVVKEGKVVVR